MRTPNAHETFYILVLSENCEKCCKVVTPIFSCANTVSRIEKGDEIMNTLPGGR